MSNTIGPRTKLNSVGENSPGTLGSRAETGSICQKSASNKVWFNLEELDTKKKKTPFVGQ